MDMKSKEWPFKYFKREEFCCKCGCGLCNINLNLVECLDCFRDKVGFPIYIPSGCRCPKHNREVDGSPTSSHLDGLAADILCEGSRTRWLLMEWLHLYFNRIGIGQNFIHVDIDEDKPKDMIWPYPSSTGRWG